MTEDLKNKWTRFLTVIAIVSSFFTGVYYGASPYQTLEKMRQSDWQMVWSNWTNKPVGIARDVNGRLEQLDVKHDRPKPY